MKTGLTGVHVSGDFVRRLLPAAGLWMFAGTVEAAAYVALAWSILHHASPGYVLPWGILSVATTVLVQRSSFHAGVRFASTLYGLLGQALSRAKLSWFTEEHRALVTTVARRSIPGLMSVPPHQISAFLYAVLMPCLLVAGTAWMLDGHTAAVMAVLLVVSFGIQVTAQRALLRVDAGRCGVEQAAARASLEFLEHVELLRSVAGPHRALERVEARWEEEERALGATARIATWAMVWAGVATALPLAGILMFMSAGQQADAVSGLAVIVLVLRASAPLDALAHAGLGIGNLVTGLRHVDEVMRAPVLPEPSVQAFRQPQGNTLEICGLAHCGGLRDLDVTIPEGQHVVITGPSGAGKSTLLGLLMRFDDPLAGEIRLGGVSLPRVRQDVLVARMACVPQRPTVFTGTLADNIRMGHAAFSDEAVVDAARKAGLQAVLERSPQGIDQEVGHHGAMLSGGERQRVALARALLKQAPILLLDEPGAAQDERTEEDIAAVVRSLKATVIVVTHGRTDIWKPDVTIRIPAAAAH